MTRLISVHVQIDLTTRRHVAWSSASGRPGRPRVRRRGCRHGVPRFLATVCHRSSNVRVVAAVSAGDWLTESASRDSLMMSSHHRGRFLRTCWMKNHRGRNEIAYGPRHALPSRVVAMAPLGEAFQGRNVALFAVLPCSCLAWSLSSWLFWRSMARLGASCSSNRIASTLAARARASNRLENTSSPKVAA
jgi:hypothetical protein